MRSMMRRVGLAVAVLGLVAGAAGRTQAGQVINFADQGDQQASTLILGGVTIEGSGALKLVQLNGLSVVGGLTDNMIDRSEWVRFSFDSGAASEVGYNVSSTSDYDGDGIGGESLVEAFGIGGDSLGTANVAGVFSKNVSLMFGGALISAFRVQADGDAIRIRSLSFNPETVASVPEPSTLAAGLFGVTLMGGAWRWRRRQAA